MIPFISDDDLSAYLGTTVTEADLIVTIALDAACQTVRDAIGRDVNLLADDVVALNGTGTTQLLLPERPVAEVTQVDVDGTTLDADTYLLDHATGILTRTDDVWTWGQANVEVTYTHGWALGEPDVSDDPPIARVPSSIRLVAVRLAAAIWRARSQVSTTGSPAGLASETIGGYSYSMDSATAQATAAVYLTDEDRRSLAPWRDLRVA